MNTTIAKNKQNIVDSFDKGDKGEKAVAALLEEWGYEFEFVGEDEEYRKKDIDFVCIGDNGEPFTIEAKNDEKGHKTGNFALETISNCTTNTPGWTLYTQADFVAIKQNDFVYFIEGPKSVEWFKANYKRFKAIKTPTTLANGQLAYYSEFRIVSKKIYDKEVGIYLISDLDGNILHMPTAS